jgi:hypothetical protein
MGLPSHPARRGNASLRYGGDEIRGTYVSTQLSPKDKAPPNGVRRREELDGQDRRYHTRARETFRPVIV